jgi:O-antigen/teichoic acid export membrane protein
VKRSTFTERRAYDLAPPGVGGQSLGRSAAGGAAWSSVGRLGSQVLQFAASLVLARFLTPTEFGLVASVLVFTQFALLFFEMGLGASLVHLRDLNEQDLQTVFWINAIGGVVFAGLLAACGPLVADFYQEPELAILTPLVALTFTLNLGVCHLALLQRMLKFRAIACAELLAACVGFGTSITCAVLGAGVYALATGSLVQAAAFSASVWLMVSWRPRGFVKRTSLPRIWRFSGGMLGFNAVNYWSRNADNLLVGRFIGAESLGLYARSFNFMTLPVQSLAQVLGRVLFPTLTAMGDDADRVARAYRRAVRALNLISAPTLVGIVSVSPALVPFLWGPAWSAMVPLLMILCVAGVAQSLGTTVGWLYQSQGSTGTMFRVAIGTSVVGIVAMVIGLRWGVAGVAAAVLMRSWVVLWPTMHLATRQVGLAGLTVLRDTVPTWTATAIMFIVVWLVPTVAPLSRTSPWTLLLQVIVGLVAFTICCRTILREAVSDLWSLAGRR